MREKDANGWSSMAGGLKRRIIGMVSVLDFVALWYSYSYGDWCWV